MPSLKRTPGPLDRKLQWLLFAPLLALLAFAIYSLGWGVGTIQGKQPAAPSTYACDPAVEPCVMAEYLEFRAKAVSSVYVDGVLSHCKEGFCLIGQPYSEFAPYRTPEELAAVIGCPNLQDSQEAFTIMREWVAAGPSRMSLQMGERACTTMNTAHYYSSYSSGSYSTYTMPTTYVYASSNPINVYGAGFTPGMGASGTGPGLAYSPTLQVMTTVKATVQATLTFIETFLYGDVPEGQVSAVGPFGFIGGTGKVVMPHPTGNGTKLMNADDVVIWIERPNGTIEGFSSSNYHLSAEKLADASYGTIDQLGKFQASIASGQKYGLYEGYTVKTGTAAEWLAKSGLGK